MSDETDQLDQFQKVLLISNHMHIQIYKYKVGFEKGSKIPIAVSPIKMQNLQIGRSQRKMKTCVANYTGWGSYVC